MFPFRTSRAAVALLEIAEAILAPGSLVPSDDVANAYEPRAEGELHPHRRAAAIERSRRPAPPQPEQTCVTPLTRAARAREALRA